MKLSIGVVGLPNVGKSTLFNALTRKKVPAENYPFCTIDPSVGIVPVPDERLSLLSQFSHSEKTIPAVIEFVDIAGLVKGASEGQGLGNQFLSHIREVDAIAHVVRMFEDSGVIHVEGGIDPLRDVGIINLELILADLGVVEKRLQGLGRDAKRGDKESVFALSVCEKLKTALSQEIFVSKVHLTDEEREVVKGLNLLTSKPMLYVLNKKAGAQNIDDMNDGRYESLLSFIQESGAGYARVDARIEHELSELEHSEKDEMRHALGVNDDGLNELITAGYNLLGLETFFTTGDTETRAWTIAKNSSAPIAGAAIHTDFKERFIRAEVVWWKDLLDAGSYASAREKGLVRTEGKEYIVKDGDVIEFKV